MHKKRDLLSGENKAQTNVKTSGSQNAMGWNGGL